MSWNNVLPWWVYETHYEHQLAEMSCCFYDELHSGTFKTVPNSVYLVHPSNFSSWEQDGWNSSSEVPTFYHQLKTKK